MDKGEGGGIRKGMQKKPVCGQIQVVAGGVENTWLEHGLTRANLTLLGLTSIAFCHYCCHRAWDSRSSASCRITGQGSYNLITCMEAERTHIKSQFCPHGPKDKG